MEMDRGAKLHIVPERVKNARAIAGMLAMSPNLTDFSTFGILATDRIRTEMKLPREEARVLFDCIRGEFECLPQFRMAADEEEERMVAAVIEMMRERQNMGGLPLHHDLIGLIEKKMKVDPNTANRVFLQAMKRFLPAMPEHFNNANKR